jgi:Spy/CpxP family protein refolding chaperone
MMERFQKEVGLTKDQVKKFETLRQQQKEGMGADFELMNSLKKEYITALFKGTGLDSLKIRYAKDLGEKMLSLDKKMYDNIMEARKICTPEQYVAYDSIVMKMMLHLPEKRTDEKNKQ